MVATTPNSDAPGVPNTSDVPVASGEVQMNVVWFILLLFIVSGIIVLVGYWYYKKVGEKMATVVENVTRLNTDVTSLHGVVTQVGTLVSSLQTTITSLQHQVTVLQGQANPDLSGLEAGLTLLESTTSQLSAVLPAPVIPAA